MNRLPIYCVLLGLVASGCTTTVQQYFFGKTDITSALVPPPLHAIRLSRENPLSITGHFLVNNQPRIKGATERPLLTSNWFNDSLLAAIPAENVTLTLQSVSAGAGIDLAVTDGFAVFAGVDFCKAGGTELNSGLAGISSLNQSGSTNIRVDGGIIFRRYRFSTESILLTETRRSNGSTQQTVNALVQRGERKDWDLFATATVYGADDRSLINGFCSFGYFQQTYLSIEPDYGLVLQLSPFNTTVDTRKTQRADYLFIYPGISLQIAENARFFAGVRVLNEISLGYAPKYLFLPSFQAQVRF